MAERICVYTVVVGGTERLMHQPVLSDSTVDFICFTDDISQDPGGWSLREITPLFVDDPGRSSRRPKILAHEYLAEYDVSLYIDNTVLLLADPQIIIERYLPSGTSMSLFKHSFRDSVIDELELVRELGLDGRWRFDEQQEHYAVSDPGALTADVLWGGMLLRRHHDPVVRRAMTTWWEHVLRYSKRDQLSLPFALRHNDLPVTVSRVDNHTSDFHRWPRVRDRTGAPQTKPPVGAERAVQELNETLRRLQAAAEMSLADHRLVVAERDGLQAAVGRMKDAALAQEHAIKLSRDSAIAAELSATEGWNRVSDLLASTSWRMTVPLRWLGTLRLFFKKMRSSR